MRVISGTARGRRLGELEGMETRPTTDRVKEALFNIVQFEVPGRKILDLFGGTGQLGIEALSRGAEHCTFVDQRSDAVALIKNNLKVTDLAGKGRVIQGDSLGFLKTCGEKFDVIFLDPPYGTALLEQSLEAIVRFDILSEHGIIICESAADRLLPTLSSPYEMGREYRYGKIKLTVFHRTGSEQRE